MSNLYADIACFALVPYKNVCNGVTFSSVTENETPFRKGKQPDYLPKEFPDSVWRFREGKSRV